MRIPRKLKLRGRTIRVRHVKMDDLGIADFAKSEILLKKGMKREAKEATLIHEILHHINSTLPHTTVDSLAEQLYQVFKQLH